MVQSYPIPKQQTWWPAFERQSQGVLLMEAESNSQNVNNLASFLSNLASKPEIS